MTALAATPVPDPLIGTVIDRYRLIGRLGEGGMGTVYSVEHVMLEKRMAMKMLKPELSRNQDLVTRFQNEAIAASRIGQENIVGVTDFGRTAEGRIYFVMEELTGRSLAAVIRGESYLTVARTLGISAQVCRALAAAHAHGIIHRDLKPENIVLVPREGLPEFVKVLDFGISKMTQRREGERLTEAGMIVGTPEYMAPEQATDGTVDGRADVYSLGVAMFEMLTGRLPFEGDNVVQILTRAQMQPVPALGATLPGAVFPPAIEALVRKALAKKPEERFQSMSELLAEIQSCALQLGVAVLPVADPIMTPSGPIPALSLPVPAAPGFSAQPYMMPPTVIASATEHPTLASSTGEVAALALGSRRRGLYAALAFVVVAAAGGGWLLLRRAPAVPPPAPARPAVASPLPVVPAPAPPSPVAPAAPAVAAPPLEAKAPAHRPVHHSTRAATHPAPASSPYEKVDDLKSAY